MTSGKPKQPLTYDQQIDVILRALEGRTLPSEGAIYDRCLDWLKFFPKGLPEGRRQQLVDAVRGTFSLDENALATAIAARNGHYIPELSTPAPKTDREERLRKLLPPNTWFEWYADYTQNTESPLSFHIMSSLSIISCALGRRVHKSMGFFSIYPNSCAILIGPTGRVKKTSAVDIAYGVIRKHELNQRFPDKMTPEALISSLVENGGTQFLYVPEVCVFLGKQQYNEGFASLLLRLMDCPETFSTRTVGRGDEIIHNIALTILGGTTLSNLLDSSAKEATSSGFLNRFLLVLEEDTKRCHSEPKRGSIFLEQKMDEVILRARSYSGEMYFTPEAAEFQDAWYRTRWQHARTVDEDTAAIIERGHPHVIRTAMLAHVACCGGLGICLNCMRFAIQLIEFIEEKIPDLAGQIQKSATVQDAIHIIRALRALKGRADHSTLLRRVSNRMGAASFKQHMTTLIESGRVRLEERGAIRHYVLKEE